MADDINKWRIETNDRYNKLVNTIMSLATSVLILPVLFLRQFLCIPSGKALSVFITWAMYLSWIFLCASILLGLLYSWVSIKWIKRAYGQNISISDNRIELILDIFFVGMFISFLLGIIACVWFFVTVRIE